MDASPVRNRLLLVLTAVLFSTGGVFIKAAALSGWQIAGFRSAVAAAALLVLLPEARRGWAWRMAPVSAAYAATLVAFVLANRLTTAANAIFLQSTAPLYVLLLGPWLLGEKVRRSDTAYIVAIVGGLALFFVGREPAVATAPSPREGNLLALASGVFYALMLLGLRWLGRGRAGNPGLATVAMGNLLAFLAALPMALGAHAAAPAASATNVAVILYLGVVQIGLAYFCLTRAIRHVTAFEATAILLIEPALNPVWVWLVHGEKPGVWALAGGVLILSATLLNTWKQTAAAPNPEGRAASADM
jgi:drug/metabolite transporter (DMT)-like permease